LPLAGEAVGVAVAALADMIGLQCDGCLDGGRLAAGLGADVEVGVVEEGLWAGAGNVVDSRSQTFNLIKCIFYYHVQLQVPDGMFDMEFSIFDHIN